MLSQNELRISQSLIVDLIEDRNFNKKSLGGTSLNNLTRFNEYIESAYLYQKTYVETGEFAH